MVGIPMRHRQTKEPETVEAQAYDHRATSRLYQDGSAFALTYRLLLRPCKLMGAFVISPLPPFLLEPLQTAGSLRSTDITPLPRYYRPGRIPLVVRRLPGVTGYTASLLRRFLDGTRRVSPVA
jgi:hypothetical protein